MKHADEMACLVHLLRIGTNQTKPNKNPKALLAQRMTLNYQSFKEQESVTKENPNLFGFVWPNFGHHCPYNVKDCECICGRKPERQLDQRGQAIVDSDNGVRH